MTSDPARAQYESLEDWITSDRTLRRDLSTIELGAQTRGRELLRLLLEAHLDRRGPGDAGPAILLLERGGLQHRLARQPTPRHRTVVTLFGPVRVSRTRYTARGGTCIHPLDAELGLPARSYSYEVQRRLVKPSVQGPFQEAVEALEEATGVGIPKRSAERVLIDASTDFDAYYAQREGARPKRGSLLVASIDGKGIPMVKPEPGPKRTRRGKGEKAQKKKMATVGTVYAILPRVRTPQDVVQSLFDADPGPRPPRVGPQDKRVWASLLAGKDAFIRDVKRELDRRDPHRSRTRVVVTDGERALQRRVGQTMRSVTLVLDFLHALEKLWAAAYVFHPEGSPEAHAWVRQRAQRILEGNVGQVVKGLRQMVTKRRLKGAKAATLLGVAGYYERNRSRMRYDEYLRKGFPIASGCVEGACKNLIKDRMERSGMRWSPEGAEAMVKMRAVYLSGDFDEYWTYHVTQEQHRLYGQNRWKPVRARISK